MQNVEKLMKGKVQIYMYIKLSDLSTLDLILQDKSTGRLNSCLDPGDSFAYHLQQLQLWWLKGI